jgi:release factor H-coupled RctB family protein
LSAQHVSSAPVTPSGSVASSGAVTSSGSVTIFAAPSSWIESDAVAQCHQVAAPGDGGEVLVAGTRGTRSALVATHAGEEAGWSVAHGAGRKMSRSDALRRGKAKHTVEELRRTPLGSIVVCGDRQLLFEEAPTAYKRIEQVLRDLVDAGLATPVAATVPLVTYKTVGGRR